MTQSVIQTIEVMYKEENREMMAMWPDIVHDITEIAKNYNMIDVAKWIEKVLQYNVPGGKKVRGLTFIYAYKLLVPNDQLTEDNIHLARILAWCLEMLQGAYIITDDVQDRSLFRRGQPCWYRYVNLGAAVLNDTVLLEHVMYNMMRKYFKEKNYYVNLLETFNNISFIMGIGQYLDMSTTNFDKKPNLDLFTINRYNSIANSKASYTFTLPITLAMHVAGIKDPEIYRQAKDILAEMEHLYQVQDDYLSCFGNFEICGKDDTDVQEGKCTWFAVKALELVTPEQRKILEECYGISDPDKVKRVKQLFIDLNLQDIYLTYEKEAYNMINVHIQQISCSLLRKLFSNLLVHFYRRES